MTRPVHSIATAAGLLAMFPMVAMLAGCASTTRTTPSASRPAASQGQPAVILDGVEIPWSTLDPIMREAAGGLAIRETILDQLLEAQLRARALTITPADLDAELDLVRNAIVREARAQPADAERLLAEVRRTRGLGDARFAAQLRRTAILRALIAPSVEVTEDELARAHALRHGETLRTRVVLVPTISQAQDLRAQVQNAEPAARSAAIAALALEHSIDPSSQTGGLIERLSIEDPTYPSSLRAALRDTAPAELTTVVSVDRGYAFALLERRTPADAIALDQTRDELLAELRLRRERLAMDEYANRLVANARPVIFDRALDWSWRATLSR